MNGNGGNGRRAERARRARNGRHAGEDHRPVRFRSIELAYGCHRRRVEFPADAIPFVILGPNGSGKSTLVEAAVRALYGFNRQRREERRVYEARRPWAGEAYEVTVGLEGPLGRITLHRDFETDRVAVRGEGGAGTLYEGEANPAASGQDARSYRELLGRLLGLAELDAYERTACVYQGDLIQTELSEDLLQLAAGGHADVEEAREAIRAEYHVLTVEPIAAGESRRRKPGQIELLHQRARALEVRLAEAQAAVGRREPLVRAREAAELRLEELAAESKRLREAFRGLTELEKLDAKREASRARVRRLEEARRRLDEALARIDLLEQREAAETSAYPEDFLERMAALEEGLWPRRDRLRERVILLEAEVEGGHRPRARGETALYIGSGLALLGSLGAWAAGQGVVAVALLLAGVAGAVAVVWLRRTRTDRRGRIRLELERVRNELADLEERVRARLEGVPDAQTIAPETLPDRRREFHRLREEARVREELQAALRGEMDRARAALEEVAEARRGTSEATGNGPESPSTAPTEIPRAATLVRRGRELLARIDHALGEERNERLAPIQLQLREISRSQFSLPEDVRPEADAVEAALEARQREEKEVRGGLEELLEKLAYEGRPAESPIAVRAELEEVRERSERLEARAAACRHAYALLAHAYDEFRRTDQERLLERVSAHLARATGGALGPVVAERGELGEARVEAADRRLALASPPLSYGQLHSALFAVRLGASDFLAGFGIRLPLLVDDPFVHLDEVRASELWAVLCRIARERQVMVATQDRLLLAHLGVEPDLRLGD